MNAATPVCTTCPYCGVGCGVVATPDRVGGAAIAGDPKHPANAGRLCSKGSALGETLGLSERLLHPMIRCRNGNLERVAWSDALDHIASRFQHIVARDGADATAFYLSGQLLTEDYYVANKFMKGFIGTANVDTNSRLCMASSVAGHKRAFGSDTVPGCYEDLDEADLIVLVGSNTAWCHPILFRRMIANRERRGARIVVIDPRRTSTADDADLFLGIRPGTDTALFCGLLVHLTDTGALDHGYIAAHTRGFSEALAASRRLAGSIAATASATGLAQADVETFFALFKQTPRVVTAYSQGVNQSAQGTDKVNAIINCHLATGRIGQIGSGPFSLTGQPNAMGGREVGGLANQLAAHMGFSAADVDRVRRFWSAPNMAGREGLKAVAMFDAIHRGEITAAWIMGTNPAVSLPEADKASAALKRLELFIVSENVLSNDTVNSGAHIVLPALAWGEKSGTVTNSERCISRQRAFLQAPGEAKPDWWIISEVARRLGFGAAFAYESSADIFREHAALSAFENGGQRDFDIGDVAAMSDTDYDAMQPFAWPRRRGGAITQRLFADGHYFTADRKAAFVVPDHPKLAAQTSAAWPLRLNTGRIRDQWHTMTRTGLSPRLGMHLPEPFVEIHPDDAAATHVVDGGFAEITTASGACVLRARVTETQQRGSLYAPIHWSAENASSARIGALVEAIVDPWSGQPESKSTPARVAACHYKREGFVLSRNPLNLPSGAWWARVKIEGGYGYLLADSLEATVWKDWIVAQGAGDLAIYEDADGQDVRAMLSSADDVLLYLTIGSGSQRPLWDAAQTLFAKQTFDTQHRRNLLSGKSANAQSNAGPVVCACFGVGRNTIQATIDAHSGCSVETIGTTLKAGTNCGSCLPELKRMLATAEATTPETRSLCSVR